VALDPTDLVRRGYDAIGPRFGAWDARPAPTTLDQLARLRAELRPGARLLDLGCGPGEKTLTLPEGVTRIGVDLSLAQLVLARELDPAFPVAQADIARPLFRQNAFDAAVALFSIIHVPRAVHETLLTELASWLRPGAPFVATLAAGDDPGSIEDDWLGVPMYWSGFDADANLEMLRRTGFAIVSSAIDEVVEEGEPVPFLCVLARRGESTTG